MKITEITEQVSTLNRVEYDINVWSEDEKVYVTFYPLRYPGDADYPNDDLGHGLPLLNTQKFYSLTIPAQPRGPKFKKALAFLKGVVNYDHFLRPDLYPAELLDASEGMDWWSTESELGYGPELITDFIAKLPRGGA